MPDLRRISRGRRAKGPSNCLGPALEQLVSRLAPTGSPTCHYEQIGSSEDIDEAVGPQVFRVAQEALTNAFRHAGADRITVTLTAAERSLRLSIQDDGYGITPGDRSGIGIASMHRRADQIGADLRIVANDDGGTTVTCIWRAGEEDRREMSEK